MLQLPKPARMRPLVSLEESYELCRQITATYAKTFYLGTLLMPEAKRRAIWAIYAWCRHTDELVDGKESEITTPATLDDWEERLEEVFKGHALTDEEVALVHTLEEFSLDIQPFRDMIAGQRMDLFQNRYQTFEDLYLYCYRVAGTVGLMSTSVMGVDESGSIAPWHTQPYVPIDEAVALGIANQLTNILRDVGEDIERGRIYLPLEELALFDYTEEDLLNGVIDDRWRNFMRFQIQRARKFYKQAEGGVRYLIRDARWPVWSALMLYQQILGAIERNDYDVFTKRAYVSLPKKLVSLPVAYMRSQIF